MLSLPVTVMVLLTAQKIVMKKILSIAKTMLG